MLEQKIRIRCDDCPALASPKWQDSMQKAIDIAIDKDWYIGYAEYKCPLHKPEKSRSEP